MPKKRIRIRLYRVQDYDLLTLYYDKNFGLRRKMVEALVAFANGRPLPSYSLKGVSLLPKPEPLDGGTKTKTGTKFVIATTVSIPEGEKAAIDLIDSLASVDLINNFLKSIIRRCLVDLEQLYIDDDLRDKYKDPGNAISSKRIVVQKIVAQDDAVEKTVKSRKIAVNKPAEVLSESQEMAAEQPGNAAMAQETLEDNEATDRHTPVAENVPAASPESSVSEKSNYSSEPEPASAADLFSFANSFNY